MTSSFFIAAGVGVVWVRHLTSCRRSAHPGFRQPPIGDRRWTSSGTRTSPASRSWRCHPCPPPATLPHSPTRRLDRHGRARMLPLSRQGTRPHTCLISRLISDPEVMETFTIREMGGIEVRGPDAGHQRPRMTSVEPREVLLMSCWVMGRHIPDTYSSWYLPVCGREVFFSSIIIR